MTGLGKTGPRPSLKIKAWLECRGETLVGAGRGRLLAAVDEEGSISAAARKLGLSYATAWHRLDSMGRAMGASLIEPRTGGKGGGGSSLTREGRAVLEALRFMQDRVAEAREEIEKGLDRILGRETGGGHGR